VLIVDKSISSYNYLRVYLLADYLPDSVISQGALSFFSGNSQGYSFPDNSQETLRLLGVLGYTYLFSVYACLHLWGVT
jgi:hypothetical protein